MRTNHDANYFNVRLLILEGKLSRPTRAKVFEWAAMHQAELRANWELARAGLAMLEIEPLD